MQKVLFILFLVLLVTINYVSCSLKPPAWPSWEMKLAVPLINDTYPIINIVDEENIFINEEEGFIYFRSDGDIEASEISERLLRISFDPEYEVPRFPIYVETFPENLKIDVVLDDDVSISYAEISRGSLQFNFFEIDDNVISLRFDFIEVFKPNGDPLSIFIRKEDTNEPFWYPLDGYTIYSTNQDETLLNLEFNVFVNATERLPIIDTNTGQPISQGEFSVYYDADFIFSAMEGYLPDNFRIEATDYTSAINVRYPANIQNAVKIEDPRLIFHINNHLGFDFDFIATVTSSNSITGETYTTEVSEHVNAAMFKTIPGYTELIFNDENHKGIGDLINIAPDSLKVYNAYFIISNPENNIGFASAGISFEGTFEAIVPFHFTFIAGEPIRPLDISSSNISENNRKNIERRVRGVDFYITLNNYMSASANMSIFIASSDDSELLYHRENLITENYARLVFLDKFMHRGTHAVPSSELFEFSIPNEEIELFYKYETIYMGFEVNFEEETSIIHPAEKIQVISHLIVEVLVDFD